MSLIKNASAFLRVMYFISKYNRNGKQLEKYRKEGNYETERELINEQVTKVIAQISNSLGVDFVIEGQENVPESGPVIIYANHQGFADILAVYTAINKFQFGFVAKEEFRKWGPVATGVKYTRSIFLDRGNARAAIQAVNEVKALTDEGFSLCIFPEGTRSRGKGIGEFKLGAFKFAQKANVPVLPVTIDGSHKMFEIDNKFHPCTVKVIVHPLVHIEEMDRKEQKQAWNDIVETITAPLVQES